MYFLFQSCGLMVRVKLHMWEPLFGNFYILWEIENFFLSLLFCPSPEEKRIGCEKRVKEEKFLKHIWFVCTQRLLAKKVRCGVKEERRYHTVQLTQVL